jgi:hypothetical protein
VLFSTIFKIVSNRNIGQQQAEHLKTMTPGEKIIVYMQENSIIISIKSVTHLQVISIYDIKCSAA